MQAKRNYDCNWKSWDVLPVDEDGSDYDVKLTMYDE